MKILIPNTIALTLDVDAEVVVYDVATAVPAEHRDAEVLVAWRNGPAQLAHAAGTMPGLRLVQTLASGADVALNAGFAAEVPICSGRSLHDGPVAEHTLTLILGAVRRLDRLHDAQHAHRWDDDFVAAQGAPATHDLHTLAGATVTIWGFGSIAARLAPMLQMLGAQVHGIARSSGERSGVPVVAEAEAAALLAVTDVLVSLVPATAQTADLFGARVFESLKPGAVFVNVGRGATVDEEALIAALESGHLRAAAIDVAKTEPLPAEDPLWDAPNLVITPHVAGNRPVGAGAVIAENVRRLVADEELVNRVR